MYNVKVGNMVEWYVVGFDNWYKTKIVGGNSMNSRLNMMYSSIALLIGVSVLLTGLVGTILPYLLSFAAGAMIYVVVEELIPESQAGEHSNIGTIGVVIGFVLMMILDVALG